MAREVSESLTTLGMEHARLARNSVVARELRWTRLTATRWSWTVPSTRPAPREAEDVEFLFASNLGEPVKPLSRIASGGEISRVMLAIKSVLASHDPVLSMVFDEIDQGVSGRIADAVAQRMAELARHRQIIAITTCRRSPRMRTGTWKCASARWPTAR